MTKFSAWLKQIASGLPDDVAESVRDEYTAHYEDAADDLMTQGLSQIEAQNKAVEQLGNADKISRRLKDVHIGRATYISAMYASMVLFLLYIAN